MMWFFLTSGVSRIHKLFHCFLLAYVTGEIVIGVMSGFFVLITSMEQWFCTCFNPTLSYLYFLCTHTAYGNKRKKVKTSFISINISYTCTHTVIWTNLGNLYHNINHSSFLITISIYLFKLRTLLEILFSV